MIIRARNIIFNFQMQQICERRGTLNIMFRVPLVHPPLVECINLVTLLLLLFIQMKANKAFNLFYFHQQ